MSPEEINYINVLITNIKHKPITEALVPWDIDWCFLYKKIDSAEYWSLYELSSLVLFLGAKWHYIKDLILFDDVPIDEYEICTLIFNL